MIRDVSALPLTHRAGRGCPSSAPSGPRLVLDESLSAAANSHISPQALVVRDVELAQAIARGDLPALFRIWVNHQSLVVSRRDLRLPDFRQAARSMGAEGWPVVVRDTGGSAVPHGPGVVQVSMLMPRSAALGLSTDEVYRQLCAPIRRALESMAIVCQFAEVPGAVCDGRFNLVVDGKKIAGTAQVWRANVVSQNERRDGYVLAHASLFVTMDTRMSTNAVRRFYHLAGERRAFSAHSLVTVHDCVRRQREMGADLTPGQCLDTVRRLLHHAIKNP